MIPWGSRWYSWKFRQLWIYERLWQKHPVVVILAGVGVLALLALVASAFR